MGWDKFYIVDILNRTDVVVKYKNNETGVEYNLEPNDIDHPTSEYIRSSDYLADGDLIPLSTMGINISHAIQISVSKQGVGDLMIDRDGDSILLGRAVEPGEWAYVPDQNVHDGLSDGIRLIMQVEIVENKCRVEFWPDKPLQPSGGYVTTDAFPGVLLMIGEVIATILLPD